VSVLSEEFVFRGPHIGPLNKSDYVAAMDTFGVHKALPNVNPDAFGFSLDHVDANRVWFMVQNKGTFTGEPGLGLGGGMELRSRDCWISMHPVAVEIYMFVDKDQHTRKSESSLLEHVIYSTSASVDVALSVRGTDLSRE